jgi:hypothetical protein
MYRALQNKMQIATVAKETHLAINARNNYNDNRLQPWLPVRRTIIVNTMSGSDT